MAIKFGDKTRKTKFGTFKFGETKDSNALKDINMTSPNWKQDTFTLTTNWKKG